LFELVAIVAILAMLTFLIIPISPTLPLRGRVTAAMANSKSIHTSLFSSGLTDVYSANGSVEWPRHGTTTVTNFQFQTSTELFTHMVTHTLVQNSSLRTGTKRPPVFV
jgi:hypothetical protein